RKSLKDLILEMEDEVLANAGVDVFEEVFKLIFSTKKGTRCQLQTVSLFPLLIVFISLHLVSLHHVSAQYYYRTVLSHTKLHPAKDEI
ncbi:MAG: hypothetical protein K6T85_18235, partial [Gorillibacterium sp.]|nr:hypothetical protein [Gorillibacterium sp.]